MTIEGTIIRPDEESYELHPEDFPGETDDPCGFRRQEMLYRQGIVTDTSRGPIFVRHLRDGTEIMVQVWQ